MGSGEGLESPPVKKDRQCEFDSDLGKLFSDALPGPGAEGEVCSAVGQCVEPAVGIEAPRFCVQVFASMDQVRAEREHGANW